MNIAPSTTSLFAHRMPLVTALTAASLISTTALAQTQSVEAPPVTREEAQTPNFGIGIGFATRQQPYTGVRRDDKAVPLVFLDTRWVKVAGSGLEVKLAKAKLTDEQQLSAGLRLIYQRDGYKAGDSPALAGMEDRKASIWGGAGVTRTNPVAQVSAEWLADVSGHSQGQKLRLRWSTGSAGATLA